MVPKPSIHQPVISERFMYTFAIDQDPYGNFRALTRMPAGKIDFFHGHRSRGDAEDAVRRHFKQYGITELPPEAP